MALNTQNVFLLYDNRTTGDTPVWAKLCDIKDFPDMGANISQIETTTLSNGSQTYIDGIHQIDALEFTINYDKTAFNSIKTMEIAHNIKKFAICFKKTSEVSGTTTVYNYGTEGIFYIDAYISVGVSGAGVDEVIEAKITLTPTNDIEYSTVAITSNTEL